MIYNPKRVQLLIKNELYDKWRIIVGIISVGFIITALYYYQRDFSLLELLSGPGGVTGFGRPSFVDISIYKFHLDWLPQMILYICCIITSYAFFEYQMKESTIFHLTTPANPLEKWSAKVILYIISIPVTLILFYQVFIWLTQLWLPANDSTQVKVNILDPYFYSFFKDIFLIQCIFFAGAILYRKFSLLKFFLLGLVIHAVYNFISIVSLILINEDVDLLNEGSLLHLLSLQNILNQNDLTLGHSVSDLYMGMSYDHLLMACSLFCIVFSYLRYKEIET